MRKLLFIATLSLAGVSFGADTPNLPIVQNIGPFSGLNNQDNPLVIPAQNAQNLLNVDITPGGRSVKKRHGYSLDATLNYSSSAVHGGYHFFDASGNDIRLWANDVNISASKNNLAYTTLITSMTDNATLQCTDSQGFAWCVDSSRDFLLRTDGNTFTWFGAPLGTEVTAGPDRLAVANVSGNSNSIYFSASGDFTNFTLGNQPSSPFQESILAPGSHLTHIRYSNGRYLWWKDQSFGYVLVQDQFTAQIVVVSYLIGTLDNSSVENEGIVYFRGQDNHIWAYDGASLTRLTREITPFATSANVRKSNFWLQTSQSDFNGGVSSQTFALSNGVLPGSLVLSTNTLVDYNNWNAASLFQVDSTTMKPSLILSTFSTVSTPANQSQLSNDNFAYSSLQCLPSYTTIWEAQTFTTDGSSQQVTGAKVFLGSDAAPCATTLRIKNFNAGVPGSDVVTAAIPATYNPLGSLVSVSFTPTTLTPNTPYWLYLDGCGTCSGGVFHSDYIWFIKNGNPYANGEAHYQAGPISSDQDFEFEIDVQGVSSNQYYTIGTATSTAFDITLTTPSFYGGNTYLGGLSTVETDNSQSITYKIQTSSGGSTGYTWSAPVTISTLTALPNLTKRYFRYIATLNSTNASLTPVLSTVTFNLQSSTGIYYSNVNNAANLTSWDTFNVTDFINGASTITYYTRVSTGAFTVLSSTPAWHTQQKNAIPAYSTGTYMQMRADFSASAASETPTINDFTFNWLEGSAADKAYASYYDFGIWWSISVGTSTTTNNRILRYDLINQTWTVYDIISNGFLIQNNFLYFGDPTAGKVYKYAGAENDNFTPINSYWQSKDFSNVGVTGATGVFGYNATDTPFIKKDYRTLNTFAASQSTGSLNVSYSLDRGTPTTYAFSMLDPNGLGTTHHNYNLPFGTKGYTINVQFGNVGADQPWELLGSQVTYLPGTYYPYP